MALSTGRPVTELLWLLALVHERLDAGIGAVRTEAPAYEESKYHLKHVSLIEKIQNKKKEKRFQEEKLARRMARRRKLLRERALTSMSLPNKVLERVRPEKQEQSNAGGEFPLRLDEWWVRGEHLWRPHSQKEVVLHVSAAPAEEVVEDPAVEAARLAKATTLRRERRKKHRQYLATLMRARKEKEDRDKEGLREAQEV